MAQTTVDWIAALEGSRILNSHVVLLMSCSYRITKLCNISYMLSFGTQKESSYLSLVFSFSTLICLFLKEFKMYFFSVYGLHPQSISSQALMKWKMGLLLIFFSPNYKQHLFLKRFSKSCTMFPNTCKNFSRESHDTSPVFIQPRNTSKKLY